MDPSSIHIALRWSASTNNIDFYRRIAPLEQSVSGHLYSEARLRCLVVKKHWDHV